MTIPLFLGYCYPIILIVISFKLLLGCLQAKETGAVTYLNIGVYALVIALAMIWLSANTVSSVNNGLSPERADAIMNGGTYFFVTLLMFTAAPKLLTVASKGLAKVTHIVFRKKRTGHK